MLLNLLFGKESYIRNSPSATSVPRRQLVIALSFLRSLRSRMSSSARKEPLRRHIHVFPLCAPLWQSPRCHTGPAAFIRVPASAVPVLPLIAWSTASRQLSGSSSSCMVTQHGRRQKLNAVIIPLHALLLQRFRAAPPRRVSSVPLRCPTSHRVTILFHRSTYRRLLERCLPLPPSHLYGTSFTRHILRANRFIRISCMLTPTRQVCRRALRPFCLGPFLPRLRPSPCNSAQVAVRVRTSTRWGPTTSVVFMKRQRVTKCLIIHILLPASLGLPFSRCHLTGFGWAVGPLKLVV